MSPGIQELSHRKSECTFSLYEFKENVIDNKDVMRTIYHFQEVKDLRRLVGKLACQVAQLPTAY